MAKKMSKVKCDKCGHEHERDYLGCKNPKHAGVVVFREDGIIFAMCAECEKPLACWPDAPVPLDQLNRMIDKYTPIQ